MLPDIILGVLLTESEVCWPAGLLFAQSEQNAGSNETAGAQAQSQAESKPATSTRNQEDLLNIYSTSHAVYNSLSGL